MQQTKSRKPILIAAAILLAVIAVFAAIRLLTREAPAEGMKTVTVEVVFAEGDANEHVIETAEEYLEGALTAEGIAEGEDREFGFFITAVDGVAADEALQQFWAITKDGVMTETGASELALADGDHYELTLTTW